MLLAVCWQMSYYILNKYKPFFHRRGECCIFGFPKKYGRLKLCRSASNVPTNRFTEYHQLRPETGNGIDWM